ncbi:hypothetical protein [Vibrio phage vB_VpaS_CHI]|nr:hypothetical protein [Vibrio phage vB_VpaS_ALK]USL90114.1 hypothetical protein [Vibrio phage vB_VpaS_CHI]
MVERANRVNCKYLGGTRCVSSYTLITVLVYNLSAYKRTQ